MNSATAEPNQVPKGQHLVHVAASNQSRAHPLVFIDVLIDGQAVLARDLESNMQHKWHEVLHSLDAGPHRLEVRERLTGLVKHHEFSIINDVWITVMFQSPPPAIIVMIDDAPVGLL